MQAAEALRLAAERAARVHVGIEIDLRERLERHLEALRIVEHRVMMVWNAPRPGIEVVAGIEFAALAKAAEFGVLVATTQRPRAAAGALVVFEHLDLVAGAMQFEGRDESGHSGAEHQHRCAARRSGEIDRSAVARFACEAERGHRLIQHCGAGRLADAPQQFAAAERGSGFGFCHVSNRRVENDAVCMDRRLRYGLVRTRETPRCCVKRSRDRLCAIRPR